MLTFLSRCKVIHGLDFSFYSAKVFSCTNFPFLKSLLCRHYYNLYRIIVVCIFKQISKMMLCHLDYYKSCWRALMLLPKVKLICILSYLILSPITTIILWKLHVPKSEKLNVKDNTLTNAFFTRFHLSTFPFAAFLL